MTQPLRRKRRLSAGEFLENLPEGIGGLPPITGESYRGPVRLTQVDEHPEEPIVELLVDETGDRFSLLDEPLLDGRPAYVALAALSEACSAGLGLRAEALDACYSPSRDAQELVRLFVARFGLLAWSSTHDCYDERNAICLIHPSGRPLGDPISRFREIGLTLAVAEPKRWGNAVAWVLQEALLLRRAMALWAALRRLRIGGDLKALRELWGWRHGQSGVLFGDAPELGAQTRWQNMADLSVVWLRSMINAHIGDTAPTAVLDTGSKWQRGGKSVRGFWLKSEMHFSSPLAGLWLQFYQDVLRESEAGRSCHECGEVFAPKRVDQEFCSQRCGNRYRQRKHRLGRSKGQRDE